MGKARRERRRLAKLAAGGASSAVSNVVPLRPADGELGVSGTVNWRGRIHAEANIKLQWERAYGTPTGTTWGEWEKLERTDHQVAAGLNMLAAPLRDSIVELEPGGDDELSQRIADFCRDNLLEWLEPRWPQLTEQMVRYGLGYGFYLGEKVWGVREDERVLGGRAVYLKKLAQRLPSSLTFNAWEEGPDGELAVIHQRGVKKNRLVDAHLPSDKVLLCTWNRTGNNYVGFSAFRPVWYLAQLRADLLKILAIGHQRESCGIPVAEVDKDASLTTAQREELQKVLEDLVYHENAGLQLPPGVKMQWVFSPGANKGHVLETWKALGLAILEVVQAQQQYLGTSETGSRAVGDVHAQSQATFVAGIRAWLEACWNGIGTQPYTGVIRSLVDYNFGAQAKYPTLKLVTKKAELPPQELAAAVATLKQAGALTLTADDENDIRERLGLRPIDSAVRESLRPVPPPSPLTPTLPQTPPPPQERADGQSAKSEPTPGAGGAVAPASPSEAASLSRRPRQQLLRLGFTPYRPLRTEEKVLALEEMDGFLDGTTDATELELKKAVTVALKSLLPVVAKAMEDGNPSELRELQVPPGLFDHVTKDAASAASAFGYQQSDRERQRGTKRVEEARADGKPGVAGEPTKLEDKRKAIQPDKALASHVEAASARVASRVKSALIDEAVKAAQRGGTPEDAVDSALELLTETSTLRSEAGGLVNTAFGIGRNMYLEDHQRDVGSVLYSAILDEDACSACLSEDGKEFPLFSAEHLAHETPYPGCKGKARCRCLLIPRWKQ